jgi:magnesium transporter
METYAHLFDAAGRDQKIDYEKFSLENLGEKQLLWVSITRREKDLICRVADKLKLENVPIESILDTGERPKIDKFEKFYRIFIASVDSEKKLERYPIDFIVGENFVITVSNGECGYFKEFLEREKGETSIGELDAESFLATLLDMHFVTYFRALEKIEERVDFWDERILKRDLRDEDFFREVVTLRRDVSKLRRWIAPHRDVIYALLRPDFNPVAESDSVRQFENVAVHFENAVDAVENSRDTVLSLFDLYATKNAHRMNQTIRRLTFITLLVGSLGAIAGVWGMNFEVEYFKSAETGFWATLAAMGALTVLLTVAAKLFRWL